MRQALLIVDMVNPFDFPGGKPLLRAARAVALMHSAFGFCVHASPTVRLPRD